MKKKIVFSAVIASLAVGLCAGSVLLSRNLGKRQIETGATVDPFVVGATQIEASSLTTSYQQEVSQVFGDNYVTMHYYLAKKTDANKLVLAPSGKVFNYSATQEYNGRITNISSVVVDYTGGNLFIEEGIAGGGTRYDKRQAITSGTPVNLVSKPNYVMISNQSAETTITSITFNYTCDIAGYDLGRFGQFYRGSLANGSTVTLEINGTNVTLGELTGTIAADNAGGFTLTLDSGNIVATGTVSADYSTLTFTGVTGAHAAYAPALVSQMKRVYVLDDFEKYSGNGTAYGGKSDPKLYQAEGIKAAYYSDFNNTGYTSWVKSSAFNTCTSSDFILPTTAAVHSGSKAGLFKGSTNGWMRFWSIEAFNQEQHYNFGTGNVLSFWAHSPYTNTSCTNAYGNNLIIRVQVYYENFELTDSNRGSTTYGTGTKEFTIAKNSDWTEYCFELDSSKSIYAFNFMINGTSGSAAYIPVDDITIQTISSSKQVAQSATKITKTYNGVVTLNVPMIGNKDFVVKVAVGANGRVYGYAGADMKPTNYVISGDQITIFTTGDYSGYTFGNWTGTLSNSNNTITIAKANVTGSIAEKIVTDPIVLNQDDVLATGAEGNTVLQATFIRQHNNGGWQNSDNSNKDTITQNSNYYIEGSNAIRLKPWADGAVRMIVPPETAEAMNLSIESIAFWYYVPAGVKYTISVFSYDDYTPVANSEHYKQPFTKTYRGTEVGWHYVNLGLTEGFDKNVAIFVDSCAKETILDYITWFARA